MMLGDESYAGSASFEHFAALGAGRVQLQARDSHPSAQAAERILFSVMCQRGDVVPNNTHFDTTRAKIEFVGAQAADLPIPEELDLASQHPFKGAMDAAALERLIEETGASRIFLGMLTVTN
jgi:tryptophanase